MKELLYDKLIEIPEEPGIYKMLDSQGTIIYIGKSKCLKKRVRSYFVPNPKWEKAKRMASLIFDVEYIRTDTHLEAMLLECTLIKKVKPYFNVLMKHDQRYVYLNVEKDARKDPLFLSAERGGHSFGPLRRKSVVENIIINMKYLYPLEKVRGGYRFDYQIFPVHMNGTLYLKNREMLLEICSEKTAMEKFIRCLENRMKKAAKEQQFERASKYRDLKENFQYLQKGLNAYKDMVEKELIYTVSIAGGYKLFYIHRGVVLDSLCIKENTQNQREEFIRLARDQQGKAVYQGFDKEWIDFRDIIYSELQKTDAGMVEIIS